MQPIIAGNATMRVSIIVIAYNLESYVTEAVMSALASDADEVIVVDDGSTDRTLSVVQRIAQTNSRLRIVTQSNGGSSRARNAGARGAKGKYLVFLDGDDRLLPGAISKLVAMLEASPSAVCAYGQWAAIDAQGRRMASNMRLTSRHSGSILKEMLRRCFVAQGCAVILKDAFNSVHGFDETISFAEDWEFYSRLAMEGDFLASDAFIMEYRVLPTSKSSSARALKGTYFVVDKIFGHPRLKTLFSDRELSLLKKQSCACAILGISNRNFWDGNYSGSLHMACLAAWTYPLLLHRIVGRAGLNCISLLFERMTVSGSAVK